ncbi:unnamed protein product [Notodromas monacha]|uniref:Methyl-CpG binding protein 2/3 C-terminal domain-containing protein n=1 Tax=Notodromas monacha TaxID=399045 RepID=A0A7R9BBW3_9CRUS|nr:unnamed protein product [Notodromas monacha]CAG0912446.1 unnamed protein product [Notodromas monacha]
MSRSKKLFDCPGLPRGWKREECIMTTGLSTGKVAFRYYSVVVVRNLASDGGKDNDSDKSNLPSSVTSSSNNHHKVKPAQVYWEKRLENVKPKYTYDRVWIASLGGEGNDNANDDDVDDDDDDDDGGGGGNNKKESGDEELLPAGLTPFPGLVDARTAVLSLAAHLTASRKRAFVGQRDHRGKVDKLPGVFVDPSEPLVKSFKISDKDLAAQEAKVNALRNKLAELQRQLMAP